MKSPFKNKNIWMSDRFKDVISSYTKGGKVQPVTSHTLPRPMYDSEIIKKLGVKIFILPDFIKTADKLMQENKDLLVDNYYANLFYVEHEGRVLVLDVSWNSDGRLWNWRCGELDEDGRWDGGLRVFSRDGIETEILKTDDTSDSLTLDSAIKLIKEAGYKVIKEL